jgi:Tol biopolymer transport system component
LRSNGTEFYFASNRDGIQDLYFVRAAVTSGPLTGRFRAADVKRLNISQGAPDKVHKDPWVSEDGQWLYFTSDREDGRDQIWVAHLAAP